MSARASRTADSRAAGIRGSALRVIGLCLAVGAVMGLSGIARGWEAMGEWALDSTAGACLGLAAGRWVVPASWYQSRLWAAVPLIAIVIFGPLSALVFLLQVFVHHQPPTQRLAFSLAPSVFGTSLVMTCLAFMVRRRGADPGGQDVERPRSDPKFLSRLPPRLRGADLYAVEAEDHYLRLHTSLGQDLILMRLADAIAELEGADGARTHRSWWVARAGFVSADRDDGRAVLTLKDGAEAPVSRAYAKTLRDRGWF